MPLENKHSVRMRPPESIDLTACSLMKSDYLLKNLNYNEDTGSIINIDSDEKDRQVILRVDTFNALFDGIYDLLSEKYWSTVDNLIHNCGYTCGKQFADRMYNRWCQGGSRKYIELMEAWFKSDSRHGFGRFKFYDDIGFKSIKEFLRTSGDIQLIGRIEIINNIQLRSSAEREVCHFLKGYCKGVLIKLARKNNELPQECTMEVFCNKELCPRHKAEGDHCVLDVAIIKSNP